MIEAVRLVVWDLDETFWKGTLTEGGIEEFVQEHHDIVVELAKRGILSSICSKNDRETVLRILEEQGIRDYFVFPSISWDPKGMRLARLVESVQLRAPTIMFIDDNPNNRAEAEAIVPGLQVADETFIPRMLADPRFKGKDDTALARLKQYQLLEKRQLDEQSASGSNEDFLRKCDVRVFIDYNVESNIDRAIELVNRTNQLNYTKLRLPEDQEEARQTLRAILAQFGVVAGLVRVKDNYGDYGYVGFFLTGNTRQNHVEGAVALTTLVHFCFSCRTLGMLIEQWVYDYLGRPELHVEGEVLTDLSVPRKVDWVRQVMSMDGEEVGVQKIASHLVFWGGCEVNAIGAYLGGWADKLDLMGSYAANNVFVANNYAARFLDRLDRNDETFRHEAMRLGLPEHLETGEVFTSGEDTLFVFKFSADTRFTHRFRHKTEDWALALAPHGLGFGPFASPSEDEFLQQLQRSSRRYSDRDLEHMRGIYWHLREHYEPEPYPDVAEVVGEVRSIVERLPTGACAIFLVDHPEERVPGDEPEIRLNDRVVQYFQGVQNVVADYNFATLISFSDVIGSQEDLQGVDHYTRQTYFRMAQRIVNVGSTLPRRTTSPVSARRLMRLAAKCAIQPRDAENAALADARTVVQASFEVLLRRRADAAWIEQEARKISSGGWHSGDFIRAVSRSEEFASKWTQRDPGEDADRSKMIDFPALRVPDELTLTPFTPKHVLIIGSCLSEGLRGRVDALPDRCEPEFYFVGSELPQMPAYPLGDYDFQIVQLALRFILPDSAFARLGQLNEGGHERLFEHAVQVMRQHLDWAMRWNRDYGLLSFVLSFIQPVQNPVGRLMPRFDLRNPVYFIERLNEALERELLLNYPNAFLFDLNEVLAHHGKRFSQEDAFTALNHGSFITDFDAQHDGNRLEPAGRATNYFEDRVDESFSAIWRELIGQYRTVRQIDPVKLVVVDLDDTMWRGVMAEADPANLPTSEGWPLGLWEALLMLKRRGIMLAILSKNEESRVEQLWQEVFGRILEPGDFVIRKINWTPKSQNMAEILNYVNLLPRNVLYIDDNPVERAAVQGAFPGLRVLGGSPLLWRRILLWAPETQVTQITTESASRTDMVRAQVEREDQRRSLSHEDFLASLDVSVKFYEVDGTDHPRFARVLELVNKTNQFNTTGRRWSREEFVSWFDQGGSVFAFEVQDRYTHYGLVGVLIVLDSTIVQFVMSCRVLGLGVEQAVLSLATDAMVEHGAASITGLMVETERNLPSRKLYAHCGFKPVTGGWHRPIEPRLQLPDHVRADSQRRETVMLSAVQ